MRHHVVMYIKSAAEVRELIDNITLNEYRSQDGDIDILRKKKDVFEL